MSFVNKSKYLSCYFLICNGSKLRDPNRGGYYLNLGYSNKAGRYCDTLSVGSEFLTPGFNCNIPTMLKCHNDINVKSFVDDHIQQILVMMDNEFKSFFPEYHNIQKNRTLSQFQLCSTCFNKVTVVVQVPGDEGCHVHTDNGNNGLAVVLIFDGDVEPFVGGEQICMFKQCIHCIRCEDGLLLFGHYQKLKHCVLSISFGI